MGAIKRAVKERAAAAEAAEAAEAEAAAAATPTKTNRNDTQQTSTAQKPIEQHLLQPPCASGASRHGGTWRVDWGQCLVENGNIYIYGPAPKIHAQATNIVKTSVWQHFRNIRI